MSYGEGPQGPGQPFGGGTPPPGGAPPPGGQPPGGVPGPAGGWQAPAGGPGQAYPQTPAKTNGMAVASLVLGILGCFFLPALLAIVLGFVGRGQIKSSGGQQKGGGMATAGIVLGFLWIAFGVLFTVLAAVGTFDETTDISRAEFVDEVSQAYLDDPFLDVGDLPPGAEDDLEAAYDDFASCVYDVLEPEPRYLEAVYDDPASEVVVVSGVSQSRIDELDDEVEDTCVPDLDDALDEIAGG